MNEFDQLPTEAANPKTRELSHVSTRDALLLINDEDARVAPAVRLVVDEIARAVDKIAARLENGGRLFYIGAGTSGRLGVVDASECPPTFGTPPELVQGIIAGGPGAVFRSVENAEDDSEAGAQALRDHEVTARDAVVGLAASGRTPYVIGALQYAREIGAWTGGISVNETGELREQCEIYIAPVVGPEALTGSTRLKAGTAQKLVLNMISTGVMLRLGRVEGNTMSDMQPWCEKLVARACRNVMWLAKVDEKAAREALEHCEGDIRCALEWLHRQAR